MRNITVKEFARYYDGLELLTRTNSSLTIGDLFDKKGMFNNILDFDGYNIAYKLGLNPDEAEKLKTELKNLPSYDGSFAGISIKDKFSAEGDLIIPSANINLTGKIDRNRIKSFEIGKIKTKVLRDALRMEVEDRIEDLKADNPREYRQELKSLYIAEALFYSDSIKITVAKDTEVNVESAFANVKGKVSVDLDKEKNQVFTISGSDYPFAADLKKIKHFI
jgi:hypothetical protein